MLRRRARQARTRTPRRYGGRYQGGGQQLAGRGRADNRPDTLAGFVGKGGAGLRDDLPRIPRFMILFQRDRWGRREMAADSRRLDGQRLDLSYQLTNTDGQVTPFPGATRRVVNPYNLQPWDADYALDLGQEPA